MPLRILSLALVVAAATLTGEAHASAAEPRIIAECGAPAPAAGQVISGPVLQVMEGGRFCVATSPNPAEWVEVIPVGVTRIAQRPEGEIRSLMMAATFSKMVSCVAADQVDGAASAACTVEGAPLGDVLKAAETQADWRSWR